MTKNWLGIKAIFMGTVFVVTQQNSRLINKLGVIIMASAETTELELGPEWGADLFLCLRSFVTAEGGVMKGLF